MRTLHALASALLLATALGTANSSWAAGLTSLITSVRTDQDTNGSKSIILDFDGPVPQYAIVSNDNQTPSLAFAKTTISPKGTTPPKSDSIWKAAQIDEQNGSLILSFLEPQPTKVVASALNDHSLKLTFPALQTTDHSQSQLPPANAAMGSDDTGSDVFAVVPLKYADVSEVVGLLTGDQSVKPTDNFTPQEPAFGSAGMTAQATGPTNGNPALTFNQQPDSSPSLGRAITESIGIDRRLNAIILRGSPARVVVLKEKIRKIDIPVQSVVLETVFVELTESGAKNVGLDFNNSNSQIATANYGTGSYNPSNSGLRGLLSLNVQGAIYAQVQKGEGRIISRPKISAQSGSTAKIITGDALPILTNITLSGVNGVSQQVQYVTVGVTLQIAPRITDDGFVSSHVFCEVSSVTGYSQGYPTISQREASTSATVKDGEAFVIGGLTEENDLSSTTKLPGAGDLPIFGRVFQHETRSHSKTQLYIVVTPHITTGTGNNDDKVFVARQMSNGSDMTP